MWGHTRQPLLPALRGIKTKDFTVTQIIFSLITDEVFLIAPVAVLMSDATGSNAPSVARVTLFEPPVQTLLSDKWSNKKV